ncbi:MAG: radical SAM protein [Nostoc sp. ChiSLP02]|nr:radical SAM protein [Nostoc sp. DedSLP05]MDZ8103292.1 radical SAM protein [Nostoc sp. DedSLP01]MDZ8187740.1 radical SAM protein [Nostoc sp. ChiSLP02]
MSKFSPYRPDYTFVEKVNRTRVLVGASSKAIWKLISQGCGFAASVEITDRCNAGCHYCYVYPSHWDQQQRMAGYLQLTPQEHRNNELQVFEVLEKLHKKGVVHLTLVGGEPALAPKVIQHAAQIFPIVWVVSNGAAKLPPLPNSVSVFISLDGLKEYHNRSRDPKGYFDKNHYGNLTGMSAAIARNINESERGAFIHLTLTPPVISQFSEIVDWLVADIKKLRGIVVSGATVQNHLDPLAFKLEDRQRLKQLIANKAQEYGWQLFPFNKPKVNQFLFDEKYIIRKASDCVIARRIESLDFNGNSVGKCILRNQAVCETCVCNMTGLQRAIEKFDISTIRGVISTLFS